MKRHPDGRFRGKKSPLEVSERILIARWVEKEVIRLKKMGVGSFDTIAELLTKAGRGELVPTVSLPDGVNFPSGYKISKVACYKAYKRRMDREPSFEAREHRQLDITRCEELFFSLQPGIKRGDAKAIEAGVRVLALKAKVIGYEAPTKIELLANKAAPIPIALVREIIDRSDKDKNQQ
jgi:hypothetical protein